MKFTCLIFGQNCKKMNENFKNILYICTMEEQNISNGLFLAASERFEDTRSENELISAMHFGLLRIHDAKRANEDDYADYQRHSGHFEKLPYERYIAGSKEEIVAEMVGKIFAFCRANEINITEYLNLLAQAK